MNAQHKKLFNAALAALAVAQGEPAGVDDKGMITASAADLIGWADDLEARVGLNVREFRAALWAFIAARDGMSAVVDAVAEFALERYYRDAAVPESERSDDDAHALVNGYFDDSSMVQEAENAGHSMADTRAAILTWHGLANDGIGYTGLEIAQVFAEAGDMVNAQLCAVLLDAARTERDAWHADAMRPDGDASDAETVAAWDATIESLETAIENSEGTR